MEISNIQHGFINDIKKGKLPWHKEDLSKSKNKIRELEKKLKELEGALTVKKERSSCNKNRP